MARKEESREPDRRAPLTADEQEFPEAERLITPAEEVGQSLQEMEDPPQAEGPRDEE